MKINFQNNSTLQNVNHNQTNVQEDSNETKIREVLQNVKNHLDAVIIGKKIEKQVREYNHIIDEFDTENTAKMISGLSHPNNS